VSPQKRTDMRFTGARSPKPYSELVALKTSSEGMFTCNLGRFYECEGVCDYANAESRSLELQYVHQPVNSNSTYENGIPCVPGVSFVRLGCSRMQSESLEELINACKLGESKYVTLGDRRRLAVKVSLSVHSRALSCYASSLKVLGRDVEKGKHAAQHSLIEPRREGVQRPIQQT